MEIVKNSQKKVFFYSWPMMGHMIPILRIAEILQKNTNWDIKFYQSAKLISRVSKIYPNIKMVEIQDQIQNTQTVIQQIFKTNPKKTLFDFYAKNKNWSDHFLNLNQQSKKPDLIISDMYCINLIKNAKLNKIPIVINCPNSLQVIQQGWNLPTFRRSFQIGGFTICYPSLHIAEILGIQTNWNQTLKGTLVFLNSSFGFDKPDILPPNYKMIGPLIRDQSETKNKDDLQCEKWVQIKKQEGYTKFIYVSFGSVVKIGKQFFQILYQTLCRTNLPILWSLDAVLAQQIKNDNFFVRSWLPQITILKIKEVQIFVTHCGWNSINQAIVYQKPLILIPVCFDQSQNSKQIIQRKLGVLLFKNSVSFFSVNINPKKLKSENLLQKFNEVLQNPIYKNNIQKVHRLSKYTKTQSIILDSAVEMMQEGSSHLIDQSFQKIKERKHWHSLVLFILAFLVYFLINKNVHK